MGQRMNHNGNNIESRLWDAVDELWANSKLKSSEYSVPVLRLVFLRYADHKFQAEAKELAGAGSGLRKIGPLDYQAKGVLYLSEAARFSALSTLPEGANIGAAINDRQDLRMLPRPHPGALGGEGRRRSCLEL